MNWLEKRKESDGWFPAGPHVTAVHHEFLGPQPGEPGFFVESLGVPHELVPIPSRMDIDFDDPGIGSDFEPVEARVDRGLFPFDDDGEMEFAGDGFHRRDQVQVILRRGERGHEDVETALAQFHT
jgi:hypothetical protein